MSDLRVSPHFLLSEFRCKDCGLLPNPNALLFKKLVRGLEKYRAELLHDNPLVIVSGIRCKRHNDSLDQSATNSCHLGEPNRDHFSAVDVTPLFTVAEVARLKTFTGIGWDNWPGNSTTRGKVSHLDVGHTALASHPVTWSYPWK